MSKHKVPDSRPRMVDDQTKPARPTPTPKYSLDTPENNGIQTGVPQDLLFDRLNYDVRKLIYDHIFPSLVPFEDQVDTRRFSGLYLSCRKAKAELDEAWRHYIMQYLNTLRTIRHADFEAVIESPMSPHVSRLTLTTNIAEKMDDVLDDLADLPLGELHIHYTGWAVDRETLKRVRAKIWTLLAEFAFRRSIEHRYEGSADQMHPRKIKISYDLDDKPYNGPYVGQIHRFTAEFIQSHGEVLHLHGNKNWPWYEERMAQNGRSSSHTLVNPKGWNWSAKYWMTMVLGINRPRYYPGSVQRVPLAEHEGRKQILPKVTTNRDLRITDGVTLGVKDAPNIGSVWDL